LQKLIDDGAHEGVGGSVQQALATSLGFKCLSGDILIHMNRL
jgi:hypothetical protein